MIGFFQPFVERHSPSARRSHSVRPSSLIARRLMLKTADDLLAFKSTMPAKLSSSETLKSAGYFFSGYRR